MVELRHHDISCQMNLALVVLPSHAESNDAIWLSKSLQDRVFSVARVLFDKRKNVFHELANCLDEFGLAGVETFEAAKETFQIEMMFGIPKVMTVWTSRA